jgi:hypothetical protein
MNRIQKISWLMVISMGTGLILSTVTITIGYFMAGFPKAWSGLAFMSIGGIGGLGPIIFRKGPGPVQADERDKSINLKAARASFALSYLVFGILCMGIWQYCKSHSTPTISIEVLPTIWGFAAVTAFFAHALMILILYGKDNKAAEGGDA